MVDEVTVCDVSLVAATRDAVKSWRHGMMVVIIVEDLMRGSPVTFVNI